MRVLVVADDTRLAELLRRGLLEEGHIPDVVADGEQALAVASSVPYDVVVLGALLVAAPLAAATPASRVRRASSSSSRCTTAADVAPPGPSPAPCRPRPQPHSATRR